MRQAAARPKPTAAQIVRSPTWSVARPSVKLSVAETTVAAESAEKAVRATAARFRAGGRRRAMSRLS
jgi:hypothetical protein